MMEGKFQFEKNGMKLSVEMGEDHIMTAVTGSEVYTCTNRKTGEVHLVSFTKPVAARHFTTKNHEEFLFQRLS